MNNLLNLWVQIPWLVKAVSADLLLFLVALLGGKLVSYFSLEKLKELRINEHFRWPLEPGNREIDSGHEHGASDFIAFFLMINVWLLGIYGIFAVHQAGEWQASLLVFLQGLWRLAFVTICTAFGAILAAGGIIGVIRSPFIKNRLNSMYPNADPREESLAESLAKATGTFVFATAALLILLAFTEIFQLTLLRVTLGAVWSLTLRLFSATAALCIGGLGLFFLLHTKELAPETEHQKPTLDLQARIGLILVTTLFAIDLIASSIGAIFWVALVLFVGLFIVPLKERLFHIWAGFSLDFHQIKTVEFRGKTLSLEKVGILYTEVRYPDGKIDHLPNHDLLAAWQAAQNEGQEPT